LDAARQRFQRADGLAPKRAMTKDEYEQALLNMQIAELDGEQLRAAHSALAAKGTIDSEAELARREKELADERGKLVLLEAGTRPEEIDAERARLSRLEEELRYLRGLQDKLVVTSSVAGIVTTPRLKEKVGQYVREGDLIGLVEEPAALEAEIALDEQQIERLADGLAVSIKLRAVPFETYWAKVDRVAPAAAKTDAYDPQARVNVYCHLAGEGDQVRPGMTGYARIYTGQRPLGLIALDRSLRLIRTEFWW
jgi:putative peptide zinc metalloprotease protein